MEINRILKKQLADSFGIDRMVNIQNIVACLKILQSSLTAGAEIILRLLGKKPIFLLTLAI